MKSFTSLLLLLFATSMLFAQEKQSIEPDWGVWIQSSYIQNESDNANPDNTFQINTAMLLVNGKTADKWSFHAMGNVKSQVLMQAWVKYQVDKYLSLRAGQFKYPFGYEAYGPLVRWKFVSPSFITTNIVKKLGAEGSLYRDTGLAAETLFPFSDTFKLHVKAMVFNGTGPNTTDNNNKKDLAAFVGAEIQKHFLAGLSVYSGSRPWNEQELDESALGFLFRYQKQSLTVQSEYIRAKYESYTSLENITPEGYYLYTTYMFPKNIEAGFRFDKYNDDQGSEKSRSTLSAGYYFNPLNRLLINYEIIDDENTGNLLTILFQAAL